MGVKLSEIIAPSFHDIAKDAIEHRHTDYVQYGGRGSTKSSEVSIVVPLLMMQHPDVHALVCRKIGNTLRDSVYNQYMWGIEQLGVAEYWTSKTAPMELTYKPTGQKIMFRGADDPMKIKSIKVPFGYIGITHFEELDQFAGREEIQTILRSTRRGGSMFWNFETFNPPRSRDNWANKDILIEYPARICHKSSYLDVPREWLGEQFIEDAERLKEIDPEAYEHAYLGVPVGYGSNVFDQIESREIADEEIAKFDRIYQGVDWGWYPDPFAFIRLHYDHARETIYFIDEIRANKKTNQETAQMIKEKKYNGICVTCDSAENKSVADYLSLGVNARAAAKGPGSVEYGMKWLQGRKIVIDPRRTPHAYEEFINYEYERDKQGNIITGYPDKNNHFIDATRYALERVYGKRWSSA